VNRLMKALVDVAFRMRAWDDAREAEVAAGRPVPALPPAAVPFLLAVVGAAERFGRSAPFDDLSEEQQHKLVRVRVTLRRFAEAGCPIVALSGETARAFYVSAPPEDLGGADWPLPFKAYGFSIDEGIALVRHQIGTIGMPEELREHFEVENGIVPAEAYATGVPWITNEDGGLMNLIENVGATIARKPDGLTVTERRPSRQSARKQRLDPDRISTLEYVIGAERRLGVPSEPSEGGGDEVTGRSMKVRTIVSPHWTHQPVGPQRSQRRLQWIASHWKGPEGAPVSVHATRVLGKPPDGAGKK
jgi:hypothetical protein